MSESTAESPRRMPGRPRSEASHQAIIQATLDLLIEVGYGALTMESVRTRAGVGKATIYRRWSSKEELVSDTIVFLHEEFETPDTGSLRGDYEALAGAVRASASRGGAAMLMRACSGSRSTTRSCSRSFAPTSSSPAARRCGRCSSGRSPAARSARASTWS
jgi:Bacterial regulatory proteins, tetR family